MVLARTVGSAILCETEDDPASVIRPRLEAAGADLNKIAFGPHLDLTRELGALIAQADTMPDLQLLVLSPIGSFYLLLFSFHNNLNKSSQLVFELPVK